MSITAKSLTTLIQRAVAENVIAQGREMQFRALLTEILGVEVPDQPAPAAPSLADQVSALTAQVAELLAAKTVPPAGESEPVAADPTLQTEASGLAPKLVASDPMTEVDRSQNPSSGPLIQNSDSTPANLSQPTLPEAETPEGVNHAA